MGQPDETKGSIINTKYGNMYLISYDREHNINLYNKDYGILSFNLLNDNLINKELLYYLLNYSDEQTDKIWKLA